VSSFLENETKYIRTGQKKWSKNTPKAPGSKWAPSTQASRGGSL